MNATDLNDLFKPVNTFVLDVDGVLTDGGLFVMAQGLMARRMNVKDGYAMQLAIKRGYQIVIISGGNSPESEDRLRRLGIQDVYFKVLDKVALLKEWMLKNNKVPENILYMGDDMPDFEVMQIVGLPCCPADGVEDIKEISKFISSKNGGYGCVRDVIERTMKARNDWNVDTHIPTK